MYARVMPTSAAARVRSRLRTLVVGAVAVTAVAAAAVASAAPPPPATRNAVIFVADGLRPVSLSATDAPTLVRLRDEGVFFANSHSLYPTFTTPNASAIATGHLLGDTGDFGNVLYPGYPILGDGSETPFVEDDRVLADLDAHAEGNYLGEESLLAVARTYGFSTAAVGKVGPTLIQDVTQGNAGVSAPATIIIDDKTGSPTGVPLDPAIAAELQKVLGSAVPPARSNDKPKTPDDNGYPGNSRTPGTRVANVRQQRFLADAVTKVILPELKRRGKPFVLVFWSRDPDATHHNQGDSLDDLGVGINGPTSRAAVRNADDNAGQILAFLRGDPDLAATTDFVVTSDHGFSTLSRRDVDAGGRASASPSVQRHAPDVLPGHLPPGFVALDIAAHLKLPLFDPDQRAPAGDGGAPRYRQIGADEHPASGNGLIGGTGQVRTPRAPSDARVIVAANGGSDLIYVPGGDAATIDDLAAFLMAQDYVDGIFVDRPGHAVPGALALADINLAGSARTPRPSIVVAFKTFSRDAHDPVRTQVDVSDSVLQQGQGMHGSFGRADVSNTMIAVGPDFKRGYVDRSPASNADIPVTLARLLHLELPQLGRLTGRVLTEALAGGPAATKATCGEITSRPTADGWRTALHFQVAAGIRYLDAAKKIQSAKGPVPWGDWLKDLPCKGK
jgi:hypothetical protein